MSQIRGDRKGYGSTWKRDITRACFHYGGGTVRLAGLAVERHVITARPR
jgi:hypothetical protein